MTGRLVVVGGGQAGFALIAKLRALSDMRPITLVAGEASLPYQRPPLSKKYLTRDMTLDRLIYRPESWYHDKPDRAPPLHPRDRDRPRGAQPRALLR